MKNQTKQTLGFSCEIIFFVLTGFYLGDKQYAWAVISLILASLFAGWTGEQIKQEVREEMKK